MKLRCGANPYDPITNPSGDVCILPPDHDGPHAGMGDVEWTLKCPNCGCSASLWFGMTCKNHEPIVIAQPPRLDSA